MPSYQGEALLPELPAEPTTVLASMGRAVIDFVRYNIAHAIPRFLRLQTVFLYPDGDQVDDRLWVHIPVMRGIFRGLATPWRGNVLVFKRMAPL
ncbi:hypothetical protein C8J57DRAFT_1519606 [Mycena rebaudengoi]|nr:hypothetical protein C8J57DRAFT_1519606 [Mycena rebaudengoi]